MEPVNTQLHDHYYKAFGVFQQVISEILKIKVSFDIKIMWISNLVKKKEENCG